MKNQTGLPRCHRIRALALVLLQLGLGVLCGDRLAGTVLKHVSGPALDYQHPYEVTRLGGRVAGAEDARRSRRASGPLVMIFGLSTARFGISPGTLEHALGADSRVVNLGGYGLSMQELEYTFLALRQATLRPDVIVLIANPMLMGGRTPPPATCPTARELLASIRKGHLRGVGLSAYLRSHLSFLEKFNHLDNMLVSELLKVRLGIAAHGRFSSRALYPAMEDDPSDATDFFGTLHIDPEVLHMQNEGFQRMLGQGSRRYLAEGAEGRALARFYGNLMALGKRVVVIYPPEPTTIRRHVAPDAVLSMQKVIRGLDPQAEIVDLRALLPDAFFVDYGHLNSLGRQAFTGVAADIILKR